jgi:PAS domain S-box-containing protein
MSQKQTHCTLLIVDPNDIDRQRCRQFIQQDEQYTYDISESTSGTEALAQFQARQPDLVLLECALPDLDGLAVLQQMQCQLANHRVAVLMLTGQGNEAIAVQAMKAGAQDYLVKHKLTSQGLCRAIHIALERNQLLHQLATQQEQQRLVSAIALRIRQSLKLEDILQTAVMDIREFFKADRVGIYQLTADFNGTVVAESTLPGLSSCLNLQIADPYFRDSSAEYYLQGNIRVNHDIQQTELSDFHVKIFEHFQIRANLIVPILLSPTGMGSDDCIDAPLQVSTCCPSPLWGLLIVSQCAAPRQWQLAEISLLEQLAVQLAIAIQQAELHQNLQAMNRRLTSTLENTTDGFVALNHNWQFVYVNRQAERLLRKTRAQLLHCEIWQIFPQWMGMLAYQEFQRAMHQQVAVEFEEFYAHLHLWVTVHAVPSSEGLSIYFKDINQRKQTEEHLRQSEERLSLAIEGTGMATWDLDTQTQQSIWSAQYFRLLGYEPTATGEATVERWLSRIYPADLDRVLQELEDAKQTRSLYNPEYRVVQANSGKIVWLSASGRFLYDESGQPTRFTGISIDITRRKQAELELQQAKETLEVRVAERTGQILKTNQRLHLELSERRRAERALRESEARFRGAFDDAAIGMALVDPNGRWLEVNTSLCDMLGYTEEELLAIDYQTLTHPDDLSTNLEEMRLVLRDEKRSYQVEKRYFHKSGYLVWALVNVSLVRDIAGEPLYFVAQIQDFTERKLLEHALQSSETKLNDILNSATACIISCRIYMEHPNYWHEHGYSNTHWKYEFCSAGCQQVFGYPPNEFVADKDLWYSRIHPEDWQSVLLPRYQKLFTQTTLTDEYRFQHKDESWHWISESVTSRWDQSTQSWVLTMVGTDISDRKRVELELQRAKEAAEVANHAKSIFLANMSHELRTPLNVILGFTQVMVRDTSLTLEQQENLRIIYRSGDHLLKLINNILDISKIEAGHVAIDESSFDLFLLLTSLRDMLRQRAADKGLQLNLVLEPHLPQFIITDPNKLRQVLMNLLSNAIKFTQTGHVTLSIGASWHRPEDTQSLMLHITVADTGVGISDDELHHIFDTFFQAQAGRSATEGTGLGLTISRKFVQLMGGQLNVTSQVGVGSVFSIDLPVKLAKSSEIPTSEGTRQVQNMASGQPTYRILVVDDQAENRRLLVTLLSQLGLDVREAVDGISAIQQWQEWQPHLIWMDIRMPRLNGYEATQQIRSHPTGQLVKIIALTAQASESDRTLALSAGCDDFLIKPFREEDLFQKMSDHLGLQFSYTQNNLLSQSTDVAQSSNVSLAIDSLAIMPTDWIAALHQAAVCCDDEEILTLIQAIPTEHTHLTTNLQRFAENYQFKAIIQLCHEPLNM